MAGAKEFIPLPPDPELIAAVLEAVTEESNNSGEELLLNKVYLMGAGSISRQENPRRLEMLLNTVLPAAERVKYFD